MSRTLLGLAVALALITPAYAQSPDLVELREEIKRMKQDYENRIRLLEERLQNVESSETLRSNPLPTETATARAGGKTTSNAFNPAISLILDGKFASLSKDPSTYALPGFARGAGKPVPATRASGSASPSW